MAFDPIEEDCKRLVLAEIRREHVSPEESSLYAARCTRAYRKDPASLIHTKEERSFHLTAKAAELLDYRVPFCTDENELDRQTDQAEHYLQEAVELDENNWDAKRMLFALDVESNEEYVDYLTEHPDEVKSSSEGRKPEDEPDPDLRSLGDDLAISPYLRWLAALSSRSLIAGRYKLAYETAEKSLSYEQRDPAGIRHTGMLALAKLESTPQTLADYRSRHETAYHSSAARSRRHRRRGERDAWTLLAEMNVAYRSMDMEAAEGALGELIRSYSGAAETLYYQAELPEGIYSRLNIEPHSEDELILAVSEATPLLQEGYGAPDSASFSVWIAENDQVQGALDPKSPRFEPLSNAPRTGGES